MSDCKSDKSILAILNYRNATMQHATQALRSDGHGKGKYEKLVL